MNEHTIKKIDLKISGMTCASCEIVLERRIKKLPGIIRVNVNHRTGNAHITGPEETFPAIEIIEEAIQEAGYSIRGESPAHSNKWRGIGASLIIIFAVYKILQIFDVLSFISSSTSGTATFGGILLIGLVAGTSSCLAVTGGLLLSVAAKYNELHESKTVWQKFKPLLYFNIGRLVSYVLLGGLVGVIGKSITLSARMTGYMNLGVAVVMLYLALTILKIIPRGSFPIRPPKRLSHWISNISESEHPAAPLGLGMLTFFLPCGFTQSLQLVALASGSFFIGSMTMGIFALGTLPALLGISAISSAAKGRASHLFLQFSGTLVLVLAIFNLNSGLRLTGVDAATLVSQFGTNNGTITTSDAVEDTSGTQIISMNVTSYGYSPNSFTISADKPTILRVTASRDSGGCANAIVIPDFNMGAYLSPGETKDFGPFTAKRSFLITCSMGMFRANVKVIN